MKRLIFILFLPIFALAQQVSVNEATIVAKNGAKEIFGLKNPEVYLYWTISKDNLPLLYIYNLKGADGFIIISADKRVKPILAYSDRNTFDTTFLPEGVRYFLNLYENQIYDLKIKNLEGKQIWQNIWNYYLSKNFKPKELDRFYILGNIEWDQGCGWNSYCPEDSDGPCGHVWAGCIATAAGMIMKYWEYPDHGVGSHSYQENDYGELSADFENTYYNWANMQDDAATSAAALLLFHIGVAVNMDYSPDGSGAFFGDELNAFKIYFGYSLDISYKERSWYSDQDWINLLKGEIDAGRPIPYKGESQQSGGHAFVCDGYDSNDNFHFNWGWSGWYNGYYSIDNLNPGGQNFTENQAIGINVQPKTPKPLNLKADTIKTETGYNVRLTWQKPEALKAISYYKILRNDVQLIQTEDTTFLDTNVPEGVQIYKVYAVYDFYMYGQMSSEPAVAALYVPAYVDDEQFFRIVPNPAESYININVPLARYKVEIYDLSGKLIIFEENSPKIVNIDKLPAGIYFLKINSDQKIITKPFVKK